MSLYRTSKPPPVSSGITEFEILKARHKFLREEGEEDEAPNAGGSWDDQLAKKYYDSLYREFAICDLKHFKSGNFSLRWRTEDEVIAQTGETTCGNSRCEFHQGSSRFRDVSPPPLTTLELPFGYEEHGERKSALVKVVLCPGCVRKLMWKRTKEKEKEQRAIDDGEGQDKAVEEGGSEARTRERDSEPGRESAEENGRRRRRDRSKGMEERSRHSRRRDRSRSRSPRHDARQRDRRRSPSRAT